ncbi:MAG: CoA ester lyase [Acidobacteria bacterium]|nr:CoA ester lyase [Acidobacteriota bacterium]
MNPYRSILFVPGHKLEWVHKAMIGQADALVLDLEDAVPPAAKVEARALVRSGLEAAAGSGKGLMVRVNALSTGLAAGDLAAITCDALDAIVIPKVEAPEDVLAYATLLDYFETANGVTAGRVEILIIAETALGILRAYELCKASSRVTSIFGGTARDGDVSRSLGYTWTREGLETLYIRSKVLLDARAAGVRYPISGTWTDLQDLEGLTAFARQSREIGYTGMFVIHPTHVEVVNRVFTPTPAEIAYYQSVLESMEKAQAADLGAIALEGTMVDIAMVEKARQFLEFAQQIGALSQPPGGSRGAAQ